METIISAIVAMVVGGVLLIGATVTDQKPELCKAMGGTYVQNAPDQCPGGKWSNLVPQPK
jgi:hypothetical protein